MYSYIINKLFLRYLLKCAYIYVRMFLKYARLYEYFLLNQKWYLTYEYRILDICVLMCFMWNVLCQLWRE